MRFQLRHLTRYAYSRPVFIEPHTIRLTPRQDPTQRVIEHALSITPEPAGRWEGIDAEGNPFVQVWFDGLAEELVVEARTTAETLRGNPFGFLPTEASQSLPPKLTPDETRNLAACLDTNAFDTNGEAARLARELRDSTTDRPLDFLTGLNTWLFGNVAKIVRRESGILDPEEVCRLRRGACRDTALLFIACCRLSGIPARFVSGYQAGDSETPAGEATPETTGEHDLHAWAEAYLPGAGWLGLDPTHGLVVADRHLALAASHDPRLVAPTSGSFRGTDATSTLHHELRLVVE